MSNKTALITGVTGQDGSYLAEFLLEKGYEVHGIKRRASLIKTDRIDHIYQDPHNEDVNFYLHYGDMTDTSNLVRLVQEIEPDEVYNLAAQSHVQVSFDTPEYTTDVDAVGVLRLLEAIRLLDMEKDVRFYQASTSELYGKVQEVPQDENTPFYPRSPYAVSKLYGYWITVNYREAYDIHASNGLLFNHECKSENVPVILKNKNSGKIKIRRLKDIRSPKDSSDNDVFQWKFENLEIWDGEEFVDFEIMTARKKDEFLNGDYSNQDSDYMCKTVNTRHGVTEATNHHTMIDNSGNEIENREVESEKKLLHGEYPSSKDLNFEISKDEAKFIGLLVGDGSITETGMAKFVNNDKDIREFVKEYWINSFNDQDVKTREKIHSHEDSYGTSTSVTFTGNRSYFRSLRKEIYTKDGYKKVPDKIINANQEVQLAFLDGYNLADGLKSGHDQYTFKNFKTRSPILAQGLLFLVKQTTNQDYNITFEKDDDQYGYYSINLLSPNRNNQEKEEKVKDLLETTDYSQRKIHRETGISRGFIRKIANGGSASKKHHLAKPKNEVKKSFYHHDQPNWVYDIQTSSGKFMAGVGSIVVSNSPRRGETFVTRKITRAVANIEKKNQEKLFLGNLNSKRDWGHAKDYVRGMWKMLQQDESDDYVLATGETHTVREFCEIAFSKVGKNIRWEGSGVDEKGYDKETGKCLIEVDPQYFRPTEVDILKGDPTKAKEKLNWDLDYSFEELVEEMIEYDLKNV